MQQQFESYIANVFYCAKQPGRASEIALTPRCIPAENHIIIRAIRRPLDEPACCIARQLIKRKLLV